MPIHTLVVMRHAKAEQAAPSDYERPLAERGRRDAAAVGEWLANRDLRPDHALVSGALRTRQTWEHVCRGAGEPWQSPAPVESQVAYDEGLYAAGLDTALDLVRGLDDDHERVVLIAHNPTVAYLAQLLDDGEGDGAATTELALGYPTSATSVFRCEGSWSDLGPGGARLQAFFVGRGDKQVTAGG